MADENKNSCENCKYFSDGLSEKGYCKLYHHKLTEPERICSRFEQKEEKRKDSPNEADYTKNAPETGRLKYKNNKRLLYLIGIVSIFVLSIALLLVDIVFAVELYPHLIPLPVKIGTLAVVLAVYLFFVWHNMMLLRKYRWTAVLYFILALAVIVLVIFDFGNVWITLNNWLNGIIDYIFYNMHMR